MDKSLPLLRGQITLEEALEEDVDIVRELSYPDKQNDFWLHLNANRAQIEQVVCRHLNVSQSDFSLGDVAEWIHGSYNAIIPIHIDEAAQGSRLPPQAIIRFPLPYKVGEDFRPGNSDEKLRSEAATYCWMRQNCPEIPVPRLFGFGFPGNQSFTTVENAPFFSRIMWSIRRIFAGAALSPYIPHERSQLPDHGYLVLEHITKGQALSETFKEGRHDPEKRANLYRDLSGIMLRLAKLPLPRIGSWTMDNKGTLTLTNRPLTPALYELENAHIPTEIPRDLTYTTVEPYLLDLIACQDNLIRYQPNSIHEEGDGEKQLAALTAMRALLPKFTDRQFRTGPFVFSLTDIQRGNIFVDEDWNITGIADVEWACARPIEMLGPPEWLSGRTLEEITFHYSEFDSLHQEFVDAFEEQELEHHDTTENAELMRECWSTGKFWYANALDAPDSLLSLFVDHIQPKFASLSRPAWDEFSHMLMRLWDSHTEQFISSKIIQHELYTSQLRGLFIKSSFDEDTETEDEFAAKW
ncbi:hypothetical protein FDECE_15401 [Fusarium decemcellulare]|nr:hypothetical protein FDECE_15401 [Fusarium decemcellulare]